MKLAQIVHVPNGMYYDCRFADLNSQGGRIKFDKADLLGEIGSRIELIIKPENVKVLGRLAWRRDGEIGVNFDKPLSWLEKHDVKLAPTR